MVFGRALAKKDLVRFIDSIPDAKLKGLPTQPKSGHHKDGTFRLDMQGMTSGKKFHNLQIQVNAKPAIPSWAPAAPNTVAGPVLAPTRKDEWSPDKIRAEFKKKIL